MKKITLYILLLSSIGLSSCNFLNVEPEKSVTFTNYFKSEAELEALYYNILVTERKLFAPSVPTIHDIMGLKCDDIYMVEKNIEVANKYRSLDQGTFLSSFLDINVDWSTAYNLIGLSSVIIDNEFRFENISKERGNFWIAQAWFSKALGYFYVARTWGSAPIVPNSEFKDPLGKAPAIDVLNEAIRCAEKALSLPALNEKEMIDSKGNKINSRQYASKGTVYTLLANIYAWMGGIYDKPEYWTKAEEYASEVIDKQKVNYSLESNVEDVCNNTLGVKRQSREVIFGIEVSLVDRDIFSEVTELKFCPGHLLVTYPLVGNETDVVRQFAPLGRVQARIKRTTVLGMYPEESDQRRAAYWRNLGSENNSTPGNEYSYIFKWRTPIFSINEDTGRPYLGVDANKVVWRLADLILLRGECRARLGRADAANDLNAIRERAGLSDYSGGGDLRREIYNERQRELFGEGQRYYDAVRNGYYDEISPEMGALTAADIERGAIYLPVCKDAFKNNSLMRQNIYWIWKK